MDRRSGINFSSPFNYSETSVTLLLWYFEPCKILLSHPFSFRKRLESEKKAALWGKMDAGFFRSSLA